jgi:UPF0755 protein
MSAKPGSAKPRAKKRPSSRPKAPKPPKDLVQTAAEKGDEDRARAKGVNVGKWVATALLALAAGLGAAVYFVYPESKGPGGGREVELDLVGDESPDALAAKLAGAGLVKSERLFSFFVRANGSSGKVARGTHLFTDDLSPREVLARVEKRGAASRVKVVVPEGWTRFDIAERLHKLHVCPKHAFLEATTSSRVLADLRIDAPSAEGFLFPATYDFAQDSLADEVVKRMKVEFDKRWASLEERHQPGMLDLMESLHWGMKEIVTLASMIEKEAVVDDERPVIASVFLNRLRDPKFVPKLLQCDPTAGYGCVLDPALPSCANYKGKITHDLVVDPANPYNTYKHEGLPPGPISSPGAKSIEAVMAPSTTRYLYFVAKGAGRHNFSETYGAHAAAIEESREKH